MSLNADTTFYSIICDLGQTVYAQELDVEEMRFNKIVEDIRDGQIENVKAVFEFNPAEGWSNDITADVMAAAFPEQDEDDGYSDYRAERVTGAVAGVEHRMAA